MSVRVREAAAATLPAPERKTDIPADGCRARLLLQNR